MLRDTEALALFLLSKDDIALLTLNWVQELEESNICKHSLKWKCIYHKHINFSGGGKVNFAYFVQVFWFGLVFVLFLALAKPYSMWTCHKKFNIPKPPP